MKDKLYKVVYFGTSDFAVGPLEKIAACDEIDLKCVVTQLDKKQGRGHLEDESPVAKAAKKIKTEVFKPGNLLDLKDVLAAYQADFFIIVSYGGILPKTIFELPKYKSLNIHPSLLPKYRGSSPIQTALLNGDRQSGVSVIEVARGVDSGNIFATKEFISDQGLDYLKLVEVLSMMGVDLLIKVLPKIAFEGYSGELQNEEFAVCCRRVNRLDGLIYWNLRSADEVINQLRAFSGWPGVYTFWHKKRLKIIQAKKIEYPEEDQKKMGEIFTKSGLEVCVKCRTGSVALEYVQLEGKKVVRGEEFVNGNRGFIASILDIC